MNRRRASPTVFGDKLYICGGDAGAFETPQIDVVLVEQYTGRSSTDAHGIGEPANIATAAANANAFYNASGKRIRRLPMSPPTVLAALAGKEA